MASSTVRVQPDSSVYLVPRAKRPSVPMKEPPVTSRFSKTMGLRPSCLAWQAHAMPVPPAPMMAMSHSSSSVGSPTSSRSHTLLDSAMTLAWAASGANVLATAAAVPAAAALATKLRRVISMMVPLSFLCTLRCVALGMSCM